MLKKASHIILSILLLIAITGLTISKHYCGEELVSTSLFSEAESCCESSDCCKNETETYQLDEDFSVSSITEIPELMQLDLFAVALVLLTCEIDESENRHNFILADLPPPPKIQTALSTRQSYLL